MCGDAVRIVLHAQCMMIQACEWLNGLRSGLKLCGSELRANRMLANDIDCIRSYLGGSARGISIF